MICFIFNRLKNVNLMKYHLIPNHTEEDVNNVYNLLCEDTDEPVSSSEPGDNPSNSSSSEITEHTDTLNQTQQNNRFFAPHPPKNARVNLSPEAYEDRRLRNRISARVCRAKKRALMNELTEENQNLKRKLAYFEQSGYFNISDEQLLDENVRLKEQVAKLEHSHFEQSKYVNAQLLDENTLLKERVVELERAVLKLGARMFAQSGLNNCGLTKKKIIEFEEVCPRVPSIPPKSAGLS